MGCCDNIAKVAHGAKQIAKLAVGMNVAPKEVTELRRSICRACPQRVPCKKKPHLICSCTICGCNLTKKTMCNDEHCPDGKW